jgi:hypothetical protein
LTIIQSGSENSFKNPQKSKNSQIFTQNSATQKNLKILNFLALKMLHERRKVFVFHELVFPEGHLIPLLEDWLQWEDLNGKRDIEIQKVSKFWVIVCY